MLTQVTLYPPSPQARQDALLPALRSRLGKIIDVPSGKSRPWPVRGRAGEISVRLRFFLPCGLAREGARLGAPGGGRV
jgi:hypothetical protein